MYGSTSSDLQDAGRYARAQLLSRNSSGVAASRSRVSSCNEWLEQPEKLYTLDLDASL